jgi:8-oxo-dGTP pyrophosphatase MutT (NUDIX family)
LSLASALRFETRTACAPQHEDLALNPEPPDQTGETLVVPIERLELAFTPRPWRFAQEQSKKIAAHFTGLRRKNPALWNGRVLMLHEHATEDGVFRGKYFETDFASMLAWRHWGFPDPAVKNCFAMGAVRASDGAFVLGVMAAHTANAGWVYFPAGVPDPSDVVDSRVDLARGLMRELREETGLPATDVEAEPGWTTVFAGARIAHIKLLHAREKADSLRERILAHLAREQHAELADVRIVGGPADLDPMMPPYVRAFLMHVWQ